MRTYLPPLLTELLPYLTPDAPAPDGTTLARIITQLAACEVEEGGPYAVAPGSARADADLGFNIAIALFLQRQGVHLPKLDAFITEACAKKAAVSRYFSKEELTDLLARYEVGQTRSRHNERATHWTEEERLLITLIRDLMERRLVLLPAEFKQRAREVVNRTIHGNPDKQMPLMPLFMRQALGMKGKRFSDMRIAELGLANVFFWTAFIIYDDFWDEDEAAEPKYLPVANLFARHYARLFSTDVLRFENFSDFFHGLMDKLDGANEWEVNFCRMKREGNIVFLPHELPHFGDFRIKFYPAAGHVLGPLMMLIEAGYRLGSAEADRLMDYFRHYLIAMQLNDDAHDWKEDLERGHISTAVSILLKEWRNAHPEHDSKHQELHLVHDLPELEQLFWFKTLPQLCESIFAHTDKAQRALDSLEFIEHRAPLQQFIDRNREAAEAALAEHRLSIEFLQAMDSAAKTQI